MICSSLRSVCDTITDRSALQCRHMETSFLASAVICSTQSWWSGKLNIVLFSQPLRCFWLRQFLMETCLRWSVSYRQHTIVRLETHPIRLEVTVLLFLLASQRISCMLVCDCFRFKWKHLPPVFTVVYHKTDADSFRWLQTTPDHMETRLNKLLL